MPALRPNGRHAENRRRCSSDKDEDRRPPNDCAATARKRNAQVVATKLSSGTESATAQVNCNSAAQHLCATRMSIKLSMDKAKNWTKASTRPKTLYDQRLPRTIEGTECHNLFENVAQDAEHTQRGSSTDSAIATRVREHERNTTTDEDPKTPKQRQLEDARRSWPQSCCDEWNLKRTSPRLRQRCDGTINWPILN
jgi:hypothetical protein